MWLFVALVASAVAKDGPWRKKDIDPKVRPVGTAYTVEQFGWQIGPLAQKFGVLDNLQIGTQTVPWLLGAPNLQGKLTAIQLEKFDLALDAGIYFIDLGRYANTLGYEEGFDANVTAPRLGFRGSWVVSRRLSVHFGAGAYFARARGQVGLSDLATTVSTLAGADIEEELRAVLGDSTDVLADIRLAMPQYRFSVDFRLNRRDSIVFTSNAFLALTGQLNAGAESTASDGAVLVEGGAYARVTTPLPQTLGTLTTLSWQFDWRRATLRLGIPLDPTNPIAWTQAVDFYLMFGRSRSKRPPGYRDSVEVEEE
ncbi:MAG: hypothetical protein AAF211_03370 [Myxococcota bacterium]